MYDFYVFFKTINWNPTIKCLSEKRVLKLQNMVFPFAPSSVLTKLYAVLCEVNHIYQVIGQTRIDFAEFFFIGTTEKSILKSK